MLTKSMGNFKDRSIDLFGRQLNQHFSCFTRNFTSLSKLGNKETHLRFFFFFFFFVYVFIEETILYLMIVDFERHVNLPRVILGQKDHFVPSFY